MPKTLKILPKWRSFAISGHTDWEMLLRLMKEEKFRRFDWKKPIFWTGLFRPNGSFTDLNTKEFQSFNCPSRSQWNHPQHGELEQWNPWVHAAWRIPAIQLWRNYIRVNLFMFNVPNSMWPEKNRHMSIKFSQKWFH